LCLAYDLKTKLQNLEVRKKLQEIVKERMKETDIFGKEISVQQRYKSTENNNKKLDK
jgi:hypothetical protein